MTQLPLDLGDAKNREQFKTVLRGKFQFNLTPDELAAADVGELFRQVLKTVGNGIWTSAVNEIYPIEREPDKNGQARTAITRIKKSRYVSERNTMQTRHPGIDRIAGEYGIIVFPARFDKLIDKYAKLCEGKTVEVPKPAVSDPNSKINLREAIQEEIFGKGIARDEAHSWKKGLQELITKKLSAQIKRTDLATRDIKPILLGRVDNLPEDELKDDLKGLVNDIYGVVKSYQHIKATEKVWKAFASIINDQKIAVETEIPAQVTPALPTNLNISGVKVLLEEAYAPPHLADNKKYQFLNMALSIGESKVEGKIPNIDDIRQIQRVIEESIGQGPQPGNMAKYLHEMHKKISNSLGAQRVR